VLEGRFDEACPMLAESQRLDPHVGTLLNLAACHEKQGKLGSAWVEYQKALTAARAEGQAERARLAEQRIAALDPKVPWLRLTVPVRPEGLSVTLDGGEIATPAFGSEMPVDPGSHVVHAGAPDRPAFDVQVDVHEGEHRTVVVSLAEPTPPLPSETKTPERIVVEPAGAPPREEPHRQRWIFEVGFVLGASAGAPDASRAQLQSDVRLSGTSPLSPPTSCASRTCNVSIGGTGGGFVGGGGVYLGYAVSESIDAGVRLLLGTSGGLLGTIGPSVSFRATKSLHVGFWPMFGSVFVGDVSADVSPPSGYSLASSGRVYVSGSVDGVGAGLELEYALADFSRGQLLATATPFFLAGANGNVVVAPLGLAYRFQ
jgi:hypothetical protein